jgi:hypothetical protein
MRTLAALAPAVPLTLYAPSLPAQGPEPPRPTAPRAPGSPPQSSAGQPPSSPGPADADDEKQDSATARADTPALGKQAPPLLEPEWLWINAAVGFTSVNLSILKKSALQLDPITGDGPTFDVGAGVRLLFTPFFSAPSRNFTAGVRVRDALLSLGSFWELNAEAALRMPTGQSDPYIGVRGGYAFFASLNHVSRLCACQVPPDVRVNGFDVGPILGIDVYLSHLVSIGAEGDVEFFFLNRSQAAGGNVTNPFYLRSGSSVGLGAGATARLGIHF